MINRVKAKAIKVQLRNKTHIFFMARIMNAWNKFSGHGVAFSVLETLKSKLDAILKEMLHFQIKFEV